MGIRNGKQFLEGLRDDREIWIDGERVEDVTADPRFAGAANTIAELFDIQCEPARRDQMTYASPSTGDRVGLSFIEPRSRDDLVKRREMVKVWMDHTCGMVGRSMDFMNCLLAGMASAAPEFQRDEHPFGDFLRDYYELCRENDLVMTHTLVPPQVDRSRPVEQQTKDVAAKIIKETGAGFIIRGARMVTTLCSFSDELLAAPSTYLNANDESLPYAYSFSIPISTPGLRFMCRPSFANLNAASPMDAPFSNRFDEGDGMVIFDDVLVPWERTFVYRDVEMCNGLFNRTGTINHMMHQFCTKNLAKAEFMMGLGFALARQTKIDAHLHVQNMLTELIDCAEFVRSALVTSEVESIVMHDGIHVPNPAPLSTVRQMFPKCSTGCARSFSSWARAGWSRCRPSPISTAPGRKTPKNTFRPATPIPTIGSACSASPSTPRSPASPAASSSTSATIPATRSASPRPATRPTTRRRTSIVSTRCWTSWRRAQRPAATRPSSGRGRPVIELV